MHQRWLVDEENFRLAHQFLNITHILLCPLYTIYTKYVRYIRAIFHLEYMSAIYYNYNQKGGDKNAAERNSSLNPMVKGTRTFFR